MYFCPKKHHSLGPGAALSPSPDHRWAHFARRYFFLFDPVFAFSPTVEPGPRLKKKRSTEVSGTINIDIFKMLFRIPVMISLLLFLQFLQELPGKIENMSRLNKQIIRRLTKLNIVPRKQ